MLPDHGLDSDFIELFDYTMKKFSPKFEKDDCIDLIDVTFVTSQNMIHINYENVIPQLLTHPLSCDDLNRNQSQV